MINQQITEHELVSKYIKVYYRLYMGGEEMEEKLLTPDQVAEKCQVKKRTVQVWLKSGKLKGVKLGKFWRVKEADLQEFINAE